MLELFAHPFSSYCWKALIALYENGTEFSYRMIDAGHPENLERLQTFSPQGKFPLLVDKGHGVFEASIIIEYLQHYHPGAISLVPPDPRAALQVRMLDRFFDNYVMTPMQRIVADHMRVPEKRDPLGMEEAKAMLERSYAWLEGQLEDQEFACGDTFSLADCAAAPTLFYADWVCEIGPDRPTLRAYRTKLLARSSVKRCVDEARPYRSYFPPGAPDRD
jgi:glutathione S-transferase